MKVKTVDNIEYIFSLLKESTSSFMQNGTTSTSSHEGHATFIGQLKEMYPEQTIEIMERALMVKGDLAGAINYLLMEGNKDQSKRIVEIC